MSEFILINLTCYNRICILQFYLLMTYDFSISETICLCVSNLKDNWWEGRLGRQIRRETYAENPKREVGVARRLGSIGVRAQLQTNMDPDLRGWIEWKKREHNTKKKRIRVSPYKLVRANTPVSSYAHKFNRTILTLEKPQVLCFTCATKITFFARAYYERNKSNLYQKLFISILNYTRIKDSSV